MVSSTVSSALELTPLPTPIAQQALLQGNLRKVFSGYDLLMLGIGITIGGGVWRLTGAAAVGIAG